MLVFYFQFSTSDDQSGAPESKQEKRRSFLLQPKSYVSKLPTPGSFYSSPPGTVSSIAKPSEVPRAKVKSPDVVAPRTLPIPIPQGSPTGQNSIPDQVESQEYFIGDRISIGGVKTGTLLYFGPTQIASGLWCGIALDEPEGIHDGLVNGKRYFTCRNGHGIFAPVDRVSHLDNKTINTTTKSSPKVSQIPSKSSVCLTSPISEDIHYTDRSQDLLEDDEDDDPLPLDDNGILHDDDDDLDRSITRSGKPRRKLPRTPRSSRIVNKLQYLRKDGKRVRGIDENIMSIAAERLQMLSENDNGDDISEGNGTFTVEDKMDNVLEHQHSAGGSSGGEDSWSFNKDYLTMCDGKAQYLNITFDGESESKTSTQEPSEEESPSPEFIFDQEMIEDGEFATEPVEIEMSQPMELSRDSSLGLISSFALDKNDLLSELFGEEEEDELMTSQETIEPASEDKVSSPERTPERQGDYDTSVDMDDGDVDIVTSAPYLGERTLPRRNFDEPTEANTTFTLEDEPEQKASLNVNSARPEEMVDSGISMRGSMSDSSCLKNSVESGGKGALIEPSIRRSMLDSGISVQQSAIIESNSVIHKGETHEKVRSDDTVQRVSFEDSESATHKDGRVNVHMIHSEMDDKKLVKDLSDGHQRKERPVSFLSTTSADTGMSE